MDRNRDTNSEAERKQGRHFEPGLFPSMAINLAANLGVMRRRNKYMKQKFWVGLGFLAMSGAVQAQDAAKVKADISAQYGQMAKQAVSKQFKAFLVHFTPDFTLKFMGQNVTRKQYEQEILQGLGAMSDLKVSVQGQKIRAQPRQGERANAYDRIGQNQSAETRLAFYVHRDPFHHGRMDQNAAGLENEAFRVAADCTEYRTEPASAKTIASAISSHWGAELPRSRCL